jgi:hypothetical protein
MPAPTAPSGPRKFCAGRFGDEVELRSGNQVGMSLGTYEMRAREEQGPGSEKNQGVDFVPCILLSAFRHRGS